MAGEEKSVINQKDLLAFLWTWRKHIIIITSIGMITSIVVSLMMTDYYKATATIAPTKTTSVELGANAKNNISEFGDEEDALRLMLILESPEIRDSITKKYNLYEHYDIDSTKEENFRYKFQKEYNNNVYFERTRENAIEVCVLDREPKIARDMANDIVRLADTVMNRMIRNSAKPRLWAVQGEMALLKQEMADYQDKLGALRDSGVVGENERENLETNLANAKNNNDLEKVAELERTINAVKKYGSDYDIYLELTKGLTVQYTEFLQDNAQAKLFAKNEVRQSHIRNYAELPDKKFKPKRMIIVGISTIASFLFACLFVILMQRFKEIRTQGSTQDRTA